MNFKFETLLMDNDLPYRNRWAPITVENYVKLFENGILKNMDEPICKNIIYNLQYLEYIDFQLKELNLHSVVTTMLFKTFIITSISIIEAIFYYILKINKQITSTDEELIFSTKSNKKRFYNEEVIIETKIYKKTESKEVEMKFDSMIKKMSKKKYLDLNHNYYPCLKYYRELRNRIHLQTTHGDKFGTDYMMFGEKDFLFIKYMLLYLLTDSKIIKLEIEPITKTKLIPREYNFLILNEQELKKVVDKFKQIL